MIKQYKTINYKHLVTSFLVNNSQVYVTFTNSLFATSDKELQQAIEKDSGFNVEFKLAHDYNNDTSQESDNKEPLTQQQPLIEVTDVTNKQLAIEWFGTLGVEISAKTKNDDIKAKAKELGYDLVNL